MVVCHGVEMLFSNFSSEKCCYEWENALQLVEIASFRHAFNYIVS